MKDHAGKLRRECVLEGCTCLEYQTRDDSHFCAVCNHAPQKHNTFHHARCLWSDCQCSEFRAEGPVAVQDQCYTCLHSRDEHAGAGERQQPQPQQQLQQEEQEQQEEEEEAIHEESETEEFHTPEEGPDSQVLVDTTEDAHVSGQPQDNLIWRGVWSSETGTLPSAGFHGCDLMSDGLRTTPHSDIGDDDIDDDDFNDDDVDDDEVVPPSEPEPESEVSLHHLQTRGQGQSAPYGTHCDITFSPDPYDFPPSPPHPPPVSPWVRSCQSSGAGLPMQRRASLPHTAVSSNEAQTSWIRLNSPRSQDDHSSESQGQCSATASIGIASDDGEDSEISSTSTSSAESDKTLADDPTYSQSKDKNYEQNIQWPCQKRKSVPNGLKKSASHSKRRRLHCGECGNCKRSNCGECINCTDPSRKKACLARKCLRNGNRRSI